MTEAYTTVQARLAAGIEMKTSGAAIHDSLKRRILMPLSERDQNKNFNPSCMILGPPVPTAATLVR